MSGGFKYSYAFISPQQGVYDLTSGCVILGAIVAQRAAQAAIETALRLEAEENALASVLNAAKDTHSSTIDAAQTRLTNSQSLLMAADYKALNRKIAEAKEAVAAARTHTAVKEALLGVERTHKEIDRAIHRKALEDARTGRTPKMTVLRLRFEELKRQAGELGGPDGPGPLDPAGAEAIRTALARAGGALQTSNEELTFACIADLQALVDKECDAQAALQEKEARRLALGQQASAEARALITGLKADEVVMRWHEQSVDDLEERASAIETLEAEQAMEGVKELRDAAEVIVKEANGAQMRADQRDYIASSISSTLEEMGFVVSAPRPEHPGHPAAASILHAATASGKEIAVSVPVDGQVWYNVEGYVKLTEAKVGGGQAAVCDEAEEVITQMHEALQSEFNVQMGELMWEGKDPNRNLRAARSEPDGRDAAHHDGGR